MDNHAWLYRLHQDGVWFVTRLKTNSCYQVIQSRAASGPVLADQIIRLSSPQGQSCYPELLAGSTTGTRRPARSMSC